VPAITASTRSTIIGSLSHGSRRHPASGRTKTQAGGAQARHDLAARHRLGAQGDGAVASLLVEVVVVAVESAAGDAEPSGEGVELVEALVRHEMAPPPAPPEPPAFVDENHACHHRRVEDELRAAWSRELGDSRAAHAALEALLSRYREPHRHYHTLKHLDAVLSTVDGVLAVTPVDDPAAVRLGAWFHDAVYDPRSTGNEAASAALAARVLGELDAPAARIAATVRLVLATVTHEPAGDDEAVLCDADLAILSARPAVYEAYVTGVRAEFAHVTDEQWRAGRAAVLRRFLDRPVIYHTSTMAPRDHRARANLTAELARLTP
jgi:predicted metal-dependent HD superfamily phosphohydrolase